MHRTPLNLDLASIAARAILNLDSTRVPTKLVGSMAQAEQIYQGWEYHGVHRVWHPVRMPAVPCSAA
eukprot:SAG31_NODE_2024_length_6644_cov_7.943621_2_plen_67_part_00